MYKGIAYHEKDGFPVEFTVSPVDYGLVRKYKWKCNRGGYIYRQTVLAGTRKSVNVYLHREIMGLEYGEKLVVDHLDGNPQNMERWNLEIISQSENLRRRRYAPVDNSTPYIRLREKPGNAPLSHTVPRPAGSIPG